MNGTIRGIGRLKFGVSQVVGQLVARAIISLKVRPEVEIHLQLKNRKDVYVLHRN